MTHDAGGRLPQITVETGADVGRPYHSIAFEDVRREESFEYCPTSDLVKLKQNFSHYVTIDTCGN